MSEKKNWRQHVADEMIRHIEAGTAPWQKPWETDVIANKQHNPTNDHAYRGINALWLEMQGHQDPRWMTLRQANAVGANVRSGEKSTQVEYWQWTERKPVLGADGKPELDQDGKKTFKPVKLDRPKVFYANVFNAEQIDGLEPYKAPERTFEPLEEAEKLLTAGGVTISHDQHDKAFYDPTRDQIHLPQQEAFRDAYEYYATSLHELGHASGHSSRMDRNFGPFGSEVYAKEELRAEMSSYMVARDLGLGHYPERHASYVESWLKAVKEDRNVLFQAARDAEQITQWIKEPEMRPALERTAQSKRKAAKMERDQLRPDNTKNLNAHDHVLDHAEKTLEDKTKAANKAAPDKTKRVYLAVPFEEKDQAKEHGAKWDRKQKTWFAPEDVDMAPLEKWKLENQLKPKKKEVDPVKEFAAELKKHDVAIKGDPLMDGNWHRVSLADDPKGARNASYRAFLDGRPNAQIKNFKIHGKGQSHKWVATGETLTKEQLAALRAEAAVKQQKRTAELQGLQKKAAVTAVKSWDNAETWKQLQQKSSPSSAYLDKKQVINYGLRVENANKHDQKLLVPAQDINGKLWSVQTIDESGNKRFQKNARKTGLMHIIDPQNKIGDKAAMIFVSEGYATSATAHDATKQPAVVAFDASNLKPVAEALRKKYPNAQIIIAADNDHKLENKPSGNIGKIKGFEAAQAVGGYMVAPGFDDEQKTKGLSDWNDLGNDMGNEVVAKQIRQQLKHQKHINKGQEHEDRALEM